MVGAAVSIISGGLRKVIRKYVYADLELREKLVNECEVIWYFGTSINGKIHPLPYYYTTLLGLRLIGRGGLYRFWTTKRGSRLLLR